MIPGRSHARKMQESVSLPHHLMAVVQAGIRLGKAADKCGAQVHGHDLLMVQLLSANQG
jgi:hypothetical protein